MLVTRYLHSDWEFVRADQIGEKVGFSAVEWLPASVPGHVHLDLIENGVIEHPFRGMAELGCQWVDEADWTYRTSFEWAPNEELPHRVLRFEGLDTVCSVLLNGDKIAEHHNMFVPLEVNVSDRLTEGTNELEVRFQSAVRVGNERRARYFAEEGLPDTTAQFPERSFVRKAQYMYGWDWGPRLVSCGIWKPVSLVEYKSRILDVQVTQKHHANGLVELHLKSEVEGEGTIVHRVGGMQRVGDGTLLLHEPELWSPESPSRLLLLSALVGEEADMSVFEVSDPDEVELGESTYEIWRTAADMHRQSIAPVQVELVRERDEFGESFEFVVNGERIWARGSNWIPDHSFPSIVDRAQVRDRLLKAKAMGHNMIRVWGGGLYESDDFYDLCDEMGLLVWQDFPFACAYYPDDQGAAEALAIEAEANIKRLRNHPCLALWCGNNENQTMWEGQWGGADKQPPRLYGLPLYERVLPDLVAKLDPGRGYIPTSPTGVPSEEAEPDPKKRNCNAGGWGDQHCWDVWHGRGDWRYYADSTTRFSSEFGFASSPTLPAWKEVAPSTDVSPHHPVVRWHDKTGKGDGTFHQLVELHYPASHTLEDWIYYSQLNQRDALRFGIEHYRRSEFCRGTLIWQLNDCWPTQSWALLDSTGRFKAAAHELVRLYDDLLVSLVRTNERVSVYVVNDSDESGTGPLELTAVSTRTGEVLRTFEGDVTIHAGERRSMLEVDIAGLPVSETLLLANFWGREAWQLVGEPKSTVFGAPIPVLASTSEEGSLVLEIDGPVVDLRLTSGGDPAPFGANYLTTHSEVLRIDCIGPIRSLEARSLAGIHPVKLTRSPIR